MSEKTKQFAVVRSYREGCVGVRVELKGDICVQGRAELTSVNARQLAADLIAAADVEDAKIAKKAAADERRQKWREREIAAGRLKTMSAKEFFRGG